MTVALRVGQKPKNAFCENKIVRGQAGGGRTSLAVQWFRLHSFTVRATKIPHAVRCSLKKKILYEIYNKRMVYFIICKMCATHS